MATTWFLQRGPHAAERPIDWCVIHLGLRPENWIGPIVQKELTDSAMHPAASPYRDLRSVIIVVTEDDLVGKSPSEWKPGLYLLDIPLREARQILQRAA
jgi:hypothetical protein